MAEVTAAGLLNRLGRITSEMVQCHKELSTVQKGREESYRDAWINSTSESIAARTRDAEFSIVDLDSVIIELKGTLAALDREYRYYELYLNNLDKIEVRV
jgi:hypothetical protein